MHKIKIATATVLATSLALAVLLYFAPVPQLNSTLVNFIDADTFHTTLAMLILFVGLSVSAAVLFSLGLRGFTKAFRRTYYMICGGIVIQSLGSMCYIYGLYAGTVKDAGFTLIAEIPLVIGVAVIYIGYLRFSRLLHMSNAGPHPLTLIGFTLIAAAIATLMPHRTDTGVRSELLFDIAHTLQLLEMVGYAIVSYTAGRILSSAGPLYSSSLRWFIRGMLATIPPTLVAWSQDYFRYPSWLNGDTLSILFVVSGLLTIASAYAFNKIAHAPMVTALKGNNLLDSVIFMGTLASNTTEVDPILDKVRLVTVSHDAGTPLTEEDTRKLESIYHELEDYLVERERLRVVDRASLRELIQERFNITVPQS